MAGKSAEVIESTAGRVAADLARRGIDPDRPVTVTVEPDDWLSRAQRDTRKRTESFGLSDDDIDLLIRKCRGEANEDMRRGAKPPTA